MKPVPISESEIEMLRIPFEDSELFGLNRPKKS